MTLIESWTIVSRWNLKWYRYWCYRCCSRNRYRYKPSVVFGLVSVVSKLCLSLSTFYCHRRFCILCCRRGHSIVFVVISTSLIIITPWWLASMFIDMFRVVINFNLTPSLRVVVQPWGWWCCCFVGGALRRRCVILGDNFDGRQFPKICSVDSNFGKFVFARYCQFSGQSAILTIEHGRSLLSLLCLVSLWRWLRNFIRHSGRFLSLPVLPVWLFTSWGRCVEWNVEIFGRHVTLWKWNIWPMYH